MARGCVYWASVALFSTVSVIGFFLGLPLGLGSLSLFSTVSVIGSFLGLPLGFGSLWGSLDSTASLFREYGFDLLFPLEGTSSFI